ncbi:MAG: hypothetical protein M3209_16705 [Acidobacteriota bacterium]|nr:hypothetical protein [Acidobacteriota bacterium]
MKEFHATTQKFLTNGQARFSILSLVGLLVFSVLIFATPSGASNLSGLIPAQAAQTAIKGEWTAQLKSNKPGEIQMNFHRRSEKGGMMMTGDTMSLSEFQGLTAEVASSKAIVNFTLAREAGSVSFEGIFQDGRGAGFWAFSPNQSFASIMRNRGYSNLSDEDLLRATLHNLTAKYIEDLKNAGYDSLEFRQLMRARTHDIDSRYIAEVKAMGFDRLPMETLIRLHNHRITAEFVQKWRSAGYENLTIEQLIRVKNHNLTPEFISGIKAEGYANVSTETAIRLKNHNIDRDFIQRAKAKGLNNVTLEELIRLRNHNIIK